MFNYEDLPLTVEQKIEIAVVVYDAFVEYGYISVSRQDAYDYVVDLGKKVLDILDSNWAPVVNELKDALSEADYITLHLPLMDATRGMFNAELFKTSIKKGAKLLNFSRGELVDTASLKSALEVGLISSYVVDFPSDEVIGLEGVVAIPHLGASSAESEDNCAVMAAEELIEYMENGNIINSVNYPNCELPRTADAARITVLHKNIPNMISSITAVFSEKGLNIENMVNKSRGDYACTILDVVNADDAIADELKAIEGIIKVRVIK